MSEPLASIHARASARSADPNDFDVAFGLRDSNLNDILARIYPQVHDQYLRGTETVESLRLTVDWNVTAAPTVRFSSSLRAYDALHARYQRERSQKRSEAELSAALETVKDSCIELQAKMALSLKATEKGVPRTVNLDIGLAVFATVQLGEGDVLTIVPFEARLLDEAAVRSAVRSQPLPTDAGPTCYSYEQLVMFLVNVILAPIAVTRVKAMLPSFTIPKLEYEGFELTHLGLRIENGLVVATARLVDPPPPICPKLKLQKWSLPDFRKKDKHAPPPTPPQPEPPKWPPGGAFVVVSQRLLAMVAQKELAGHENFSARGEGEWEGIRYAWRYALRIAPPRITVNDGKIRLEIAPSGMAKVKASRWPIELHYGVDVTAEKPPAATLGVSIKDGNEIDVAVVAVDPGAYNVRVSGYIPSWIRAHASKLVDELAAKISSEVKALLTGMRFVQKGLPQIDLSMAGADFLIDIESLSVVEASEKLGVGATLKLSGIVFPEPIYESTWQERDGLHGMKNVYYYSTQQERGVIGTPFYAHSKPMKGTVPIYRFRPERKGPIDASNPQQRNGYRLNQNRDMGGWTNLGIAFHAYPKAGTGLVPVYEHGAPAGSQYRLDRAGSPAFWAPALKPPPKESVEIKRAGKARDRFSVRRRKA